MATTAPRLDRARKLESDLRAVLNAADLETVTVTLDAGLISSGARDGIVVISAPKLDFSAWGDVQAEYVLHVIAGPATDYLAAWERIDTIVQALVDGDVNLKSGEPGGYADARTSATLPAYTLTLNDLDN